MSPKRNLAEMPLKRCPKRKKGIEPVIGKSTAKTMHAAEKIRKPARIISGSGQAALEEEEGRASGCGKGNPVASIAGGYAAKGAGAAKAAATRGRVKSTSHQIPIPSGIP